MSQPMNLPDLLKATLELKGSDLHLSMGSPPQVRVDGHLRRLDLPELTPDGIKAPRRTAC
jgi:twitching motility protein PilT